MSGDTTNLHRRVLIGSLPLPNVLSELIAEYEAEAEDRLSLERALQRSLLGKFTLQDGTDNHQRHKQNSHEIDASSSCSSTDADSSRQSQSVSISHGHHSRALLDRLLSHPEFPRHRCSHLLILLDAENNKPPGQYEVPSEVASGGALVDHLDAVQLEQWNHLTTNSDHLIEFSSSSSTSPLLLPQVDDIQQPQNVHNDVHSTQRIGYSCDMQLAASLQVVRLESQALNAGEFDKHCQRLLVSCLSWNSLPSLYRSGTQHEDTDVETDYASIAWPAAGFFQRFEIDGPFERGQLPISKSYPAPTDTRLLADIFPRDAQATGPFLYSRVSGLPQADEVTGRTAEQYLQPDSVYLLDAASCLQEAHKTFKWRSRSDAAGVDSEIYVVRDCIGVIIQLPSAPSIETIADARLVVEQLNQLEETIGRRGSQAMYDVGEDMNLRCPSFDFAACSLRQERSLLRHAMMSSLTNSSAPVTGQRDSSSTSLSLQRILSAWLRPAWPMLWKQPPSVTDGATAASALLVSSSVLSRQLGVAAQRSFEQLQKAEVDAESNSSPSISISQFVQQPLVSPLQTLLTSSIAVIPSRRSRSSSSAADSNNNNKRSTRSKRGSSSGADVAPSSSSTSLPSSHLPNFLSSVRFPVSLSSLCIEFELTRYSRLGTRVIYRAASEAYSRGLQAGVYSPLPATDQDLQRAAVDSHGFVTLESLWPSETVAADATRDSASSTNTFTASLSELLNAMRTFYESPFSDLEWRFLRRAVDAGTLSITDPGVQELLLPKPVIPALPNWPHPRFNWSERWISRSLELMGLDSTGTLAEKGMRILTHESVGMEKFGTEQSFDSSVNLKIMQESREAGEPQPFNFIVTSDWSEEDESLLAQGLWAAHPLQDDPDRPPMLQRPGGLRMTVASAPQFIGTIGLPVVWSYQEFLHTLRGDATNSTARRPEVAAKIESVLQRVHQQRSERIQSPGTQAMAQSGKRGGKARKGAAVASVQNAVSTTSSASSLSVSSAASSAFDREPCARYLLLCGRQRIALMDVTTVEVAHSGSIGGMPSIAALTAVDIKLDIELE